MEELLREMLEANLASITKMFEIMQQIPGSVGSDEEKEIARKDCLRGLYGAFMNLGIVPEADAEEIGKIVGIVNSLAGVTALVS